MYVHKKRRCYNNTVPYGILGTWFVCVYEHNNRPPLLFLERDTKRVTTPLRSCNLGPWGRQAHIHPKTQRVLVQTCKIPGMYYNTQHQHNHIIYWCQRFSPQRPPHWLQHIPLIGCPPAPPGWASEPEKKPANWRWYVFLKKSIRPLSIILIALFIYFRQKKDTLSLSRPKILLENTFSLLVLRTYTTHIKTKKKNRFTAAGSHCKQR